MINNLSTFLKLAKKKEKIVSVTETKKRITSKLNFGGFFSPPL